MDKKQFKQFLTENIMILDGATGTELQKLGLPKGECPEKWVLEHPDTLVEIQTNYIKSGSNAILSCTFGGNSTKLNEFGLGDKTVEINKKLAALSKNIAGPNCLVAGDIAPTGLLIEPFGSLAFDAAVDIYKEQIRGLLEGRVDFFFIETMLDIQEARAALLAVKESCDLPVCVSMTFDNNMRTLTGTDPVTALIILQSLGADAVGCNCSVGPDGMLDIISAMKPYARVPILAKPNAGMPKLVDNKTVFDMGAEEFGSYGPKFIEVGANILGGCCGTSPDYIAQISEKTKALKPSPNIQSKFSAVTSSKKTVFIGDNNPLVIVGERINPTGKKKLQQDLILGNTLEVRRLATEQVDKGAGILDVNVGMPGIDEKETMLKVVNLLSNMVDLPLCIDSSSPDVIEAALRLYPGRALINSISAEKIKIEKLLPIAAKYGAMFVILPLSDDGVPKTAIQRCRLVEDIYDIAQKYGYTKSDIVVDGLVMTVSVDENAALETLEVIEWCSRTFGCNTIVGLSNVSFGLPERNWINSAFLAMGICKGLSMAIANPSSDMVSNLKFACDVLIKHDKSANNYIKHFAENNPDKKNKEHNIQKSPAQMPIEERIFEAVVKGNSEEIITFIDEALNNGKSPSEIVDNSLIPGINKVGHLYDSKEYFLPQLIKGAEVMKKAFSHLEPLLYTGESYTNKSKVILATVKGDIHDIGKNIVCLMLRNYGFDVYDLGKDVSTELIISKAQELNADIIGLSALMTTTMVEMKNVINAAKQAGLQAKFMIGGAVIDENYAIEIGADGYSKDAYEAVKLAQKLTST
ncbi:homocysteine S-methyltransferase family protein [Pseudobacteroides cellulosolvens]|uniref:Methionine synthase n=1 Tax=Pseudobacteroides cellulosolvens ATCC 35603 = DSM 2933 TaxID=398512 RepID=A0A0L6JX30_9FIRM|nr:homocysteine S-methyltransferase family protein [Pseudobacteroides cellulosolvens]KNY30284.1 Methionine synthase [Pseudobacteroides cellulosolvens ATCC 35603 = DSM 2933]